VSASQDLVSVRDEGTVRWLGLNRPEKKNALNHALADALSAALDDARTQPCVLIVYSTTPGIFAAGADIAELRDRDADGALLAINAGVFERLSYRV
jgi:enoyl-CoA hydratase